MTRGRISGRVVARPLENLLVAPLEKTVRSGRGGRLGARDGLSRQKGVNNESTGSVGPWALLGSVMRDGLLSYRLYPLRIPRGGLPGSIRAVRCEVVALCSPLW